MHYATVRRYGYKWVIIAGSDEEGVSVWWSRDTKMDAERKAKRLVAAKGWEYRGISTGGDDDTSRLIEQRMLRTLTKAGKNERKD